MINNIFDQEATKKQQRMRQIIKAQRSSYSNLITTTKLSFGTFNKILFLIRGFLNKMANEETRQFKTHAAQNPNPNLPKQAPEYKQAQTMEQAQKLFLQSQKLIQQHQNVRMARLDEIMGTNTYQYKPKNYQQRISVDAVMTVQYLQEKEQEISRHVLDIINPQMNFNERTRKSRKHIKWLKKLKQYPEGRTEVIDFNQKKPGANEPLDGNINNQLIKFLGQQALFTKLALSDLQLTISSVTAQSVLSQRDGVLINRDEQQLYFHWNAQVYFRPIVQDCLYRIDQAHFSKKLIYSLDDLASALVNKTGNILQVISHAQIYECMLNYYYDERVHQYLRRFENQQNLKINKCINISPDGKGFFIVFDLLNNGKEFMGIFKSVGHGDNYQGIHDQNIIFNILPEVALRNDGEMYFVQRSQQGMYTELCKTKFNIAPKLNSNAQNRESKQKSVAQSERKHQEKRIQASSRPVRTFYRCKPFQNLRILSQDQPHFISQGKGIFSGNVTFEQKQIGKVRQNKIFFVTHTPGIDESSGQHNKKNMIQQITVNNQRLEELYQKNGVKNRFPRVYEWGVNPNRIYSQSYEVIGVGYLIVRYQIVGTSVGSKLKYGSNPIQAIYASLIPYKGYRKGVGSKIQPQQQYLIEGEKRQLLTSGEGKNTSMTISNTAEQFHIRLPQQSSISTEQCQSIDFKQLEPENQQIIYVCPENHYIIELKVTHASASNIYMLANLSVESVYNRNSLYIHPLRRGVNPYSVILDGYPIKIGKPSDENGKIGLVLVAPLLSVPLQYTLWKKQLKQVLNDRIYTETITIRENEQSNLKIKIVSNKKFAQLKLSKTEQSQPIILYIPSSNQQRLDQPTMYKMLQKGVIFAQITQCRGMFGSTMIQTLRGTQQFYHNYVADIYDAILYLKKNVSQRIGVYAEGPTSCYAILMINILQNSENQLFDASVLHEGLYDLDQVPKKFQYAFGDGKNIYNPYKYKMFNPKKSAQNEVSEIKYEDKMIYNLSKMLFSSLRPQERAQSRKFIHKLRKHRQIFYQTVYLKQFDLPQQKDIYNLSYLYKIMKQNIQIDYKNFRKEKSVEIEQQGSARSRENQDRINKDPSTKYQKQNN